MISVNLFSIDSLYFDEVNLESRVRPIYAVDMTTDHYGNIWISTTRGLYRIDGYKGHFYANNPNDSLSLIHNTVFSVYTDQQNQVWICTDKGLQKYLPEKDGFEVKASKYFEENSQNLYALSIYTICQIDSTKYLFGSKMGLFIYNETTDQISENIPLTKERKSDNFSTNEHVYKISPSPNNQNEYYLLTRSGICLFNASTQNVTWLENPDKQFFNELSTRFYDLEVSKNHIVVLDKEKFWMYNMMDATWIEFTDIPVIHPKEFNVKKAIVRDIEFINDEHFLISTIEDGMFDFSLVENTIKSIKTLVGIDQPFLIFNKMTIDDAGYLWTLNDISPLIKSNVPIVKKQRNFPLHILLDHLKVNNRLIPRTELPLEHNTLKLANYQRQILIEYALVNPSKKDSVKYSYKLKGFDKDWVNTGTNRIANYTKLRPGNYEFYVKAEMEGMNIEKELINFQIPKYFYETWLFRSIIAFVTIGVIFIVWNLQRKRKKEIQQFNVQLKDMELQALRAQMNPHFLFNTLNSIKNYVLTKGSDEAAEYLTKFSQLIRKILENSKQPLLSLDQEIEAMKLYVEMEHLRFNKDFTYSFDIDEDINTHRFKIAPMIIQPYIENAIWHGLMNKRGEKELTISFLSKDYGVLCIVDDNGIGRAASKKQYEGIQTNKKSLGLKITGDRIENINQLYGIKLIAKIIDKNGTTVGVSGTRVEIQLPYINEKVK